MGLPSGRVQRLDINPKAQDQVLTVRMSGVRRVHVFLLASTDTRRETSDVWWYLSASATLAEPILDLPRLGNITEVNLAPSVLAIPPLGAALMHVATAFWMSVPMAESISIKFTTPPDQPSGKAIALGYPDPEPHDFFGLFRAPFGHPQHAARLVEPLPLEPGELQRLQLEDRVPPAALPPRRK